MSLQFVMILMTVCFLLETYFYRWLHYNLYIERSAGVYKVIAFSLIHKVLELRSLHKLTV